MASIITINLPRFSKLVAWDRQQKKIVNRNIFVQLYHRLINLTSSSTFNDKVQLSAREAALHYVSHQQTNLRDRTIAPSKVDYAQLHELISQRLHQQFTLGGEVIDAKTVTTTAQRCYQAVVSSGLPSFASPAPSSKATILKPLTNPNPYHSDQPAAAEPGKEDAYVSRSSKVSEALPSPKQLEKKLDKLEADYDKRQVVIDKLVSRRDKLTSAQLKRLAKKETKNQQLMLVIHELQKDHQRLASRTTAAASSKTTAAARTTVKPKTTASEPSASAAASPTVAKQAKFFGSKKLAKVLRRTVKKGKPPAPIKAADKALLTNAQQDPNSLSDLTDNSGSAAGGQELYNEHLEELIDTPQPKRGVFKVADKLFDKKRSRKKKRDNN